MGKTSMHSLTHAGCHQLERFLRQNPPAFAYVTDQRRGAFRFFIYWFPTPFYTANIWSLWKQNEIKKSEWDEHKFLEEIALLDMLLVWNGCNQLWEYNMFYSIFKATIFTGLFMRCSRALIFFLLFFFWTLFLL